MARLGENQRGQESLFGKIKFESKGSGVVVRVNKQPTTPAPFVLSTKLRGKSKPLTAAALKALREEDTHTLAPARVLATEAVTLERQLSDLVNAAYGLTPAEVQLMWDTAPPRMPIAPPM